MRGRPMRPSGGGGSPGRAGALRLAGRPHVRAVASAEGTGTAVVRIRLHHPVPSRRRAGPGPWERAGRLLSLLQSHPSYRVLAGEGAAGILVIVRFTYHSLVELSRLYDQLLWLVELSTRTRS